MSVVINYEGNYLRLENFLVSLENVKNNPYNTSFEVVLKSGAFQGMGEMLGFRIYDNWQRGVRMLFQSDSKRMCIVMMYMRLKDASNESIECMTQEAKEYGVITKNMEQSVKKRLRL